MHTKIFMNQNKKFSSKKFFFKEKNFIKNFIKIFWLLFLKEKIGPQGTQRSIFQLNIIFLTACENWEFFGLFNKNRNL